MTNTYKLIIDMQAESIERVARSCSLPSSQINLCCDTEINQKSGQFLTVPGIIRL